MMDNNDRNWEKYGMHVVNAQLNTRPSRVKANYSPNQIFYGKRHDKLSVYNILGMSIVKAAETEAGLEAAYKAVCESNEDYTESDIMKIIKDADREFLQELQDEGVLLEDSEKIMLLSSSLGTHDDDSNKERGESDSEECIGNEVSTDIHAALLDFDGGHVVGGGGVDNIGCDGDQDDVCITTGNATDDMGDKGKNDQQTQDNDSSDGEGDKGDKEPQATASNSNQTQTEYGDSPNRGQIRANVFKSTVAQAKEVNNRRTRLTKDILDLGDICNLQVEGKIRGATGPNYLPVTITDVSKTRRGNMMYTVATKHGILDHKYQHQELFYMPLLTKDLLSIDEGSDLFREKRISEQTAVSLYSVVGVTGKCKCKGDCGAPGSKCSCKIKGIFCTSKCHGGRGTKGDLKCTFRPTVAQVFCEPCNEES